MNTFSIPYALLNDGINANTGKLTSNITMQPFHPKLVKAFFGIEETGEISRGINHESFQIVDKMLSESHEKSSLMDQDESISIDHQSGNVYPHGKAQKLDQLEKEIQLVTVHKVQEALQSLDPEDLLHPQFSWKEDTYIRAMEIPPMSEWHIFSHMHNIQSWIPTSQRSLPPGDYF